MTKSTRIGRGYAHAGAICRRRRPVKPGEPVTKAELRTLARSHAATALACLAEIAARGGNGMSRVIAAKTILRLAGGLEEPAPSKPAENLWGDLLASKVPAGADD